MARKIEERSSVQCAVFREDEAGQPVIEMRCDCLFVVSCLGRSSLADSVARRFGVRPPTLPSGRKLHPEGFAARTVLPDSLPHVLILGSDERGCVYGVGAVLRSLGYGDGFIEIPSLQLKEKPA
ncbi:MAG: hypothetical protein ACTSPX_05420, partial [Candidatus Thorarchaeota archaeon]